MMRDAATEIQNRSGYARIKSTRLIQIKHLATRALTLPQSTGTAIGRISNRRLPTHSGHPELFSKTVIALAIQRRSWVGELAEDRAVRLSASLGLLGTSVFFTKLAVGIVLLLPSVHISNDIFGFRSSQSIYSKASGRTGH
jgi:hypothetical protein